VSGTLAGQGAVVTGGGRGIGAAIAQALAETGARVVVAARTESEIAAVAASIREAGGEAWPVGCDVTSEAGVEVLAAAATQHLGQVDILVNNAGAASSAPIARTTLAEWNRLFAVNATSAFLCTRAFLPAMIERGRGRIVNIASTAGLEGGPYIAAYAAAKHALVGLTQCAAAEAGPHGVTVNAVCPGYVDTDLTRESIARIIATTGRTESEALASILASSSQDRLIDPADVARAVLWLCEQNLNGEAIWLDGKEAFV
jgi:3-hydroxybutyrate dehydrogenase